jgi:hypothetical protein
MKAYDLIQVLWVEDDPKVTETYPLKAECFDLELVPFPCWDDAKAALESDYDRWSAIILDAKCKHHRDSKDSAVVFLREALKDISVLSEKKGHIIPWYVLTGGDESEVSDSINDERMQWDKDWTDSENKKYYSKNVDNEKLFRRIRYHAYKSPRIQIQEMYRNVFEAIEECGIDDEGYNALEDLLVPIHFPDAIEDKDYNDKFEKAREVLEYIFRSMSVYGILPDWGKKTNLQWSSCILGGKPAINKKGEVAIQSNKRILPEALAKIVKAMVNVIPPFCHSDGGSEDGVSKKDYMTSVDSSTFLLKSYALQLCDFVLWYRHYLREHPDKERNALEWEVIDKNAVKTKK